MKLQRSVIAALVVGASLAACSGNLGSGATPPVSAPAAGGPVGGVAPQSVAGGPAGAALAGAPGALSLEAHRSASLGGATPMPLPTAAGFGGTLCLTPATSTGGCGAAAASPTPIASPVPSATPTVAASATPSASPAPSETPRAHRVAGPAVLLTLHAYPTAAPPRDGNTDDGATQPLLSLEVTPAAAATLPGLGALVLTLPAAQLVNDRHFALGLFDADQKTEHGAMFTHRKGATASTAVAVDSTVTGTSLQFNDATAPVSLVAKHHYLFVLYTDGITPTSAPATPQPLVSAIPAASASAAAGSATAVPGTISSASPAATVLPTPYVTYPNSTGLPAATPISAH